MRRKAISTGKLSAAQLKYYHELRHKETDFEYKVHGKWHKQHAHPAAIALSMARRMYETEGKDIDNWIKQQMKAINNANESNLEIKITDDHIGLGCQCLPVDTGIYSHGTSINQSYGYLDKIHYRLVDIKTIENGKVYVDNQWEQTYTTKYVLQVISNEPIHSHDLSIKRNDLVGAIHTFDHIIPTEYPAVNEQIEYRKAA
jgi:hypothetical protein